MKALILISTTALAIVIHAGATSAQSGQGGDWLGIGELTAKLEAQGYTVREVERDDGRYEVELTDANGVRYEAKVDRSTGDILHRERDDD